MRTITPTVDTRPYFSCFCTSICVSYCLHVAKIGTGTRLVQKHAMEACQQDGNCSYLVTHRHSIYEVDQKALVSELNALAIL